MMRSVDMSRTHEIMARYRPIAPKPPVSCTLLENPPPLLPEKLTRLHIPTRTSSSRARKRGRGACSYVSQKRAKTFYSVLPSLPTSRQGLSMQSFNNGFPLLPFPGTEFQVNNPEKPTSSAELLSLSLLSHTSPVPSIVPLEHAIETKKEVMRENDLDLNCEPETTLDLLQNLTKTIVIVPQPVRPIGSSISVGCISEEKAPVPLAAVSKKPEEVEEEVESDDLPAVVSDSNNRVRLANSAYKEMVGQPECSWLDSMVTNIGGAGPKAPSKRINGGVMLDLANSSLPVPANGFSCRVKIEWACNGRKSYVDVPCDVIRLACESKDYFFTWRFNTSTEVFDNNCKA